MDGSKYLRKYLGDVEVIGIAYYLFALTFIIGVITDLTRIADLAYLSFVVGIAGFLIIFWMRKSLLFKLRQQINYGMAIFIIITIFTTLVLVAYIASQVAGLVTSHQSLASEQATISRTIVTSLYIVMILSSFSYIAYFLLNDIYNKKKDRFLLAVSIIASVIFTITGFAGSIGYVSAELYSVSNLSSATLSIESLGVFPYNIFTIPSVIGPVIMALVFYKTGRELRMNPRKYVVEAIVI
ncbi:MAG: hypothetical protein M1498_02405 [Candidatus Thermoplasmatota archaeon]|nr:hypothetical protein [Candidatus Thermoplasmatota archaeon]